MTLLKLSCPECKMEGPDCERYESDPVEAVRVLTLCECCGIGAKDPVSRFFDADDREVFYREHDHAGCNSGTTDRRS